MKRLSFLGLTKPVETRNLQDSKNKHCEKKISITAALFPAAYCRGLFLINQTEEADDLFRLE